MCQWINERFPEFWDSEREITWPSCSTNAAKFPEFFDLENAMFPVFWGQRNHTRRRLTGKFQIRKEIRFWRALRRCPAEEECARCPSFRSQVNADGLFKARQRLLDDLVFLNSERFFFNFSNFNIFSSRLFSTMILYVVNSRAPND